MDPVTHGLIGATVSQSFASKRKIRLAGITGFISAMLADLDVLIFDPSDPLLNLEIHRQLTHSLIFIPVGALVGAILVWFFVRRYTSFSSTYFFSLLGYATAGVADIFTSYGVKLLWPFIDERYSLNIISVFDPLFTIGLILTAGVAFYQGKKMLVWVAWIWILLYLLFGYGQHKRAENVAQKIADRQAHIQKRTVIKPTIGNELLWSIRYETMDSLHTYGVRITPFSESIIYSGESVPLLNWQKEYERYRETTLYKDIKRFSDLSEGFLIRHPSKNNVIGDGRYAMLPTSVSPLWGIQIDTTMPDQHVAFKTYRDIRPEVRESFFNMLLGRSVR